MKAIHKGMHSGVMSSMVRRILLPLLSVLLLSAPVQAADEGAPADYVGYIELKPFVTNYGSDGKIHFLKAEVTLQVSSQDAHHAVNAHLAQIRNDLVFLFSAQEEQNLQGVAAQQLLAEEALKLLQDTLTAEEGQPYLSDLFFTSLVIQ